MASIGNEKLIQLLTMLPRCCSRLSVNGPKESAGRNRSK